jgi:hypothetical protein
MHMQWYVLIMFGLYSAGTCCGWYLDNLWLCWLGVWTVPGCIECQMLPLVASKQALSWCELTGIHVYTVAYKYRIVNTSTYYYVLVCTSIYWYLLVFTTLFRCWGAGLCARHHCSGPALSLQHHRWYWQCSLCRLFVCTPPAILQVPTESY